MVAGYCITKVLKNLFTRLNKLIDSHVTLHVVDILMDPVDIVKALGLGAEAGDRLHVLDAGS